MTNVQKPVGGTATITAAVVNEAGLTLPGYTFSFTADSADTVNQTDATDATLVGTTVETVNVTATTTFPDGTIHTGTGTVDFIDNVPVAVNVTIS